MRFFTSNQKFIQNYENKNYTPFNFSILNTFEYIINSKRDENGRSDSDRLPHLFKLMNPSNLALECEPDKNLFHMYIFPFTGNTSQGNAMRPYGLHSVVGCWTNKFNNGQNPEKTLITESLDNFIKGSLSRTISHELGHVLGLSHNCSSRNNCLITSKGYFINNEQFVISEKEARKRQEPCEEVITKNLDEEVYTKNLVRFTPDQADWNTFQTKPLAVSGITSHAPDDIGWIPEQDWVDSQWDGTTIYDPTTMTKAEFHKALFPTPDTMRGLREVFYQHNPFKDNKNPTKAEVDEWHRIAINHLRALVGYASQDRQVKKDHCMFQRALWGQQRRFTTIWDTKYPGTQGSAFGPCQGSSNSHCGATFVPDAQDQIPYLSEGQSTCGTPGGAEGVTGAPKSNIPWSIKWVRAIGQYVGSEGFWGGHVGPFFHREKFGFSFWDDNVNDNNSNATLRAKWTGKLMPNLYEMP